MMVTQKLEPTKIGSTEKGRPPVNLNVLSQAAAVEHARTPLQALRIYWRSFFWCIFMCIGMLLWGYDAQVRLPLHSCRLGSIK